MELQAISMFTRVVLALPHITWHSFPLLVCPTRVSDAFTAQIQISVGWSGAVLPPIQALFRAISNRHRVIGSLASHHRVQEVCKAQEGGSLLLIFQRHPKLAPQHAPRTRRIMRQASVERTANTNVCVIKQASTIIHDVKNIGRVATAALDLDSPPTLSSCRGAGSLHRFRTCLCPLLSWSFVDSSARAGRDYYQRN